jgi:hypothetical protein
MRLRSSLEVSRPAVEVFDVVSDFTRNPEWQRGMKSAAWTTDPPIRIGSSYQQKARFLGRDVLTDFEVTGFEPSHSITIESRQSSFPIRVTRMVESISTDRCLVIAEISGEPGRFFRVLGPLLRILAERSVRGDYRRLKALLEK